MRALLALLFVVLTAAYIFGAVAAFWMLVTADGKEALHRLAVFFGVLSAPLVPTFGLLAWERPRLFLLAPLAAAAVALTFGVHYSGSWITRAVDASDWAEAVFSFVYKGVLSGVVLLAAFAIGGAIVTSARE